MPWWGASSTPVLGRAGWEVEAGRQDRGGVRRYPWLWSVAQGAVGASRTARVVTVKAAKRTKANTTIHVGARVPPGTNFVRVGPEHPTAIAVERLMGLRK